MYGVINDMENCEYNASKGAKKSKMSITIYDQTERICPKTLLNNTKRLRTYSYIYINRQTSLENTIRKGRKIVQKIAVLRNVTSSYANVTQKNIVHATNSKKCSKNAEIHAIKGTKNLRILIKMVIGPRDRKSNAQAHYFFEFAA